MGTKLKKVVITLLLTITTSVVMASTWIDFTVEFSDTTLEDLASTYYGDASETAVIYNANKELIGKNRKLEKGMELKIPVTDKFRDQPERLGWR